MLEISSGYAKQWLADHPMLLLSIAAKYFQNGYSDTVIKLARDDPCLMYDIAKDHEVSRHTKEQKIIDFFAEESKIALLIADRRSGKTAFAFWLAEQIAETTTRKIFWVGRPRKLPPFITQVKTISDVPKGALAIVDEASLTANAREHSKSTNINLSKLLAILGHKDISVLYITQSSALTDLNIARLTDVSLFKLMNTQAQDMDREYVSRIPSWIMPHTKEDILFVNDKTFMRFTTPLPKCWSDELSKPYASIKSEEMALKFADSIFSLGYTVPEIVEELAMADYIIKDSVLFRRYFDQLKGKHDIQDIMETLTGQSTKLTEKMVRGWVGAEA